MKSVRKKILFSLLVLVVLLFLFATATLFFDQAVLVRKNTFYRAQTHDKLVALTFDDGPSPEWTPQILDALSNAGVKATFFMIGKHVRKYPEIARRVVKEGHEVGNHTYNHHVLIYYKMDELDAEISDTEKIIREVAGVTTKYFRPPKAWLTEEEKKKIRSMGYTVVLWSLNSKDWVTFDDKYIVKFLVRNIRLGDIILFHDSGGVFGVEGGDRHETVKAIPNLVEKLKGMGYRFVTVSELLELNRDNEDRR